MKSLIQKLSQAVAPSGSEAQVRALVKEALAPYVDELQVDNLGNLIARKGQRFNGGLKIMLAAHMDENGLIVSHIDENGFARFIPTVSWPSTAVVAGRVKFVNGAQGIIGSEISPDNNYLPAPEQLFIDLGASDRQTCPVQVGEMGVLEGSFLELGDDLVGKALDDRVGVAILIEAVHQIHAIEFEIPHELFFVFSAQEQLGSRGAAVAAFGIDPDLALTVDLAPCSGTPKGLNLALELGRGPAIKVRDPFMLSDPRVVDWMVRTAEGKKLPYQLEVHERALIPGSPIQLSRAGVPAGGISLPTRYLHTTSEMVSYNDVENALRLLLELLRSQIELSR